MENQPETRATTLHMHEVEKKKPVAKKTIFLISAIVLVSGLGASFYFADRIEKFFLETSTKSVAEVAHNLAPNYLEKSDLDNWQNPSSNAHLMEFAQMIKEHIPNTAAVKIYSDSGVLAWTDLKNITAGHQKPESDGELAQVRTNKNMTLKAGQETKDELVKENLLEIWSVMETPDAGTIGFIEIYFDYTDIKSFVAKIKYTVWAVIITMLGMVLVLINLALREQDTKIVEQSEYLNGIISQSPIGIYTINPKGFIESYNPSMLKISELTDASEMIGKNVFDAVAYKENGFDKLLMSGLGGVPFDREVEMESSTGEHKKTYRHYYGSPLKNEKGEVVHLLVMVEDITIRKELEKEVALHAGGLETKIKERTKAIQEKIDELEKFQHLTVGREIRMTELKQEIEKMRIKLESLGVKDFTV